MLNQDQFKSSLGFTSLTTSTDIFSSGKQWHLLYETDTGRIISASVWHATMLSMQNFALNTVPLWWMNSGVSKLPREFDTTRPWQCIWDPNTQTFNIDTGDMAPELLNKYLLLAEKSALLDRVHHKIYNHRRYLWNDELLQPTIYHMKYLGAQAVLADADAELHPQQWPLVYDYAELVNLPLRQAAELIVTQYRIWETRISNTETLRLRTIRRITDCDDILEIQNILKNFTAESDLYGRM